MPYDTAANSDALETLLADMFPDVLLSRAGVALLANRISDMEKWSATIHHRIDPKRPERERQASMATRQRRRFY